MVQIDPLYDKKITCPACQSNFTTKKIRSRAIRTKETDTDFCMTYQDPELDPDLYYVHVCQACGYAGTEQFSTKLSVEATDAIQKKITDKWTPADYGQKRSIGVAINAYKLALYTGTLTNEKAIVMAGVALRLAWLHRKGGEAAPEERFLRMALTYYTQAYAEADYSHSNMTDIRVLYLIGEIHRRLGNRAEAIKSFSEVIQHKHKELDPKIVEMAREQNQEARQLPQ